MSSLFRSESRVVWREGSLLSPQHLQHQERYLEAKSDRIFRLSQPYPWGVLDLEIDTHQIGRGEFHLKKLRAIFQDGLHIALGEQDPLPTARSFQDAIQKVTSALTVYIAVPVEKPGISSFDPTPEEIHETERRTRYCVRFEHIFDQTRDHERVEIQLANTRSRIVFEKESRDDYVSLPIARIVRAEDSFKLDDNFIPPIVSLDAYKSMVTRVLGLVETAQARIALLKRHRSSGNQQGLDIRARDTGIYLWLFALSSRTGQLKALISSPNLSPFALFRELCSMERQLSCLVPALDTPQDFTYAHDDLYETLVPLIQRISTLIAFPFRTSFLSTKLDRREDGMWLGNLKDEFLRAKGDIVLAITSKLDREEMARRLPELAKLASFTQVSGLVHSALRGAALTDLRLPPESIPSLPETVYFAIDPADSFWKQILKEKNVALYFGDPYHDAKMDIELMIGLRGTNESIVLL